LLQLLPPTLPGVDSVERDTTDLTRAVYYEFRENRPGNTSIAYDPKVAEFNGYCDAMYAHIGVDIRYQVTPEKVYNFLFYQSHREKKKPGSRKERREGESRCFFTFLLPHSTQISNQRYGYRQLTQYSSNRLIRTSPV
jgi:hypothetical protein